MKIDIHTHIMPEKMPRWTEKFGYGEFIHLEHKDCGACMMKGENIFRIVEKNCYTPAERITEMDQVDVTIQVLSTIPVLFNYWAKPQDGYETARFFNDHIAETVANDNSRFIGLGTLPMQDVSLAIKEMERCVKELRFPGVEIGSNINGINLGDKSLHSFYEAAEELGCSIFIHPWEMMGENQMTDYWLPWLVGMPAETSRSISSMIFGGIFEKFKNLRVAYAHGGGSFAFTLGRLEHGFKVRPDLVAKDNPVNPKSYLGKFWVDGLVHDRRAFALLMDVVGEDRICIGSDYPFPLGEKKPGRLIEKMALGRKIEKKMFYKNALEWMNISSKTRPEWF
jgi:aminocarboxymuconate-semialdehyde decarboxylase